MYGESRSCGSLSSNKSEPVQRRPSALAHKSGLATIAGRPSRLQPGRSAIVITPVGVDSLICSSHAAAFIDQANDRLPSILSADRKRWPSALNHHIEGRLDRTKAAARRPGLSPSKRHPAGPRSLADVFGKLGMKNLASALTKFFCAGWLCLVGTAAMAQPEITVVRGDESYPPFEMVVDGQLTGLHIDLVEAAAKKLGAKVKWQSLPWKRALRMVELGQADAVTYITRTPEREAWAVFLAGNVLSNSEVRFIVLQEKAGRIKFDGNLARFVERYTPIVVRGFAYGKEELDRSRKLEGSNMQDVVRMLRAGHSDIAVLNWGDFVGAFKDTPELAAVAPLNPPLQTQQNYIAFSRINKDEDLARRFAAALLDVKNSAEYAALLRRYRLER